MQILKRVCKRVILDTDHFLLVSSCIMQLCPTALSACKPIIKHWLSSLIKPLNNKLSHNVLVFSIQRKIKEHKCCILTLHDSAAQQWRLSHFLSPSTAVTTTELLKQLQFLPVSRPHTAQNRQLTTNISQHLKHFNEISPITVPQILPSVLFWHCWFELGQ